MLHNCEIGVNHNGSMLLAKKLIDKAKALEQTQLNFKHLKLKDYLKNTPKVAYQKDLEK